LPDTIILHRNPPRNHAPTPAVEGLDVSEQAVGAAQSYLELSGFSCQGLIDQLSSEFGDKYTVEEATYGASQAGVC